MKRMLPLLLVLLAFAAPAYAAPSPSQVYERLEEAYRTQNKEVYRMHITARSLPWVTKLEQYPLNRALPGTSKVIGETVTGAKAVVRVSTPMKSGKQLQGDFIFHKENGWKLDLPDTFEKAMGPRWEDTLNMTDQMLSAMRSRMPPAQYEAFQNKTIEQLKQQFTDR